MNCGRVRKPITVGLNHLIEHQLNRLQLSVLSAGDISTSTHLETTGREFALVLVRGSAAVSGIGTSNEAVNMGPRPDPVVDKPWGILYSGGKGLDLSVEPGSLLAIASAPAKNHFPTQIVRPGEVREAERGKENWTRRVRLLCWADNSEGEQLLVGETITPSGNWSTIPPHRHAEYRTGPEGPLEVPYDEVYFYQFSRPSGFGLCWQFDPDSGMDQAFSLKAGDAVYLDGGYHPVTCGPGSTLYQLTLMAGPYRQSTAAVHPDYEYLLGEAKVNPFRNQEGQIR